MSSPTSESSGDDVKRIPQANDERWPILKKEPQEKTWRDAHCCVKLRRPQKRKLKPLEEDVTKRTLLC